MIFALGATLGSLSAERFGERAIWMSCAMLLVSFFIMFAQEEEAEKEKTKV